MVASLWKTIALVLCYLSFILGSWVWPQPQNLQLSGARLLISNAFDFTPRESEGEERLQRGIARFHAHLRALTCAASGQAFHKEDFVPGALETIEIKTSDPKQGYPYPDQETDYSYSIQIATSEDGQPGGVIQAVSHYGVLYALETLLQLASCSGEENFLVLQHSQVQISDSPDYAWRGLMVDSGRRFFPISLLNNLMDTMLAVKLNVLHLHASDRCRFGVESKLYPNLTKSLTGIMQGFYTQEDIHDIVEYAADRGIRVVPEFDMPGHSHGFLPIQLNNSSRPSNGVVFCTDGSDAKVAQDQLFGDPNGLTKNVITNLYKEMSSLFPDSVFHIGSDETEARGQCSVESTFALERDILNIVDNSFAKTPAGWEEVLFDAGAATNDTIVSAWSKYTSSDITKTGRRAIESHEAAFYFTRAVPGGPAGWSSCWYQIDQNVPTSQKTLLLGGEMSMWSDTYCYIDQCLEPEGKIPVGSALFPPEMDAEFSHSIGGMIWPRGYVAAGAFWNYDSQVDPSSDKFVQAIYTLNDKLQLRGSFVCPSNCTCDQLTACGKPYVKPTEEITTA